MPQDAARPGAEPARIAAETEIARLQAELSSLRDDRQRAECMASIQSDAVQLALDLLVTHPDLRGFFRMFIKRLVDDSGRARLRRLAARRVDGHAAICGWRTSAARR